MNELSKNQDKELKDLLNQSREKITRPDFTDQLMKRIEKYELKKIQKRTDINRSRIFTLVSLVLLGFIIGTLDWWIPWFAYLNVGTTPHMNQIFVFGQLLLVIGLVLFQINNLMAYRNEQIQELNQLI